MHTLMTYEDCYVRYDERQLAIGNDELERTWDFSTGRLATVSLRNKRMQDEWCAHDPSIPTFRFSWLSDEAAAGRIWLSAEVNDDCGIAKPHLKINVDQIYEQARVIVRFAVRIYPHTALIRQECQLKKRALPDEGEGHLLWSSEPADAGREESSVTLRLDANNKPNAKRPADYIDFLHLDDLHARFETVCLRDVTDTHNNLVSREQGLLYPNEQSDLRGNLIFMSKTLKQSGLLIIKEGPTPLAHLQDPGHDYRFLGKRLFVSGSGVSADDLSEDEYVCAYGSAVGTYDGSAIGGLSLLDRYHKSVHRYRPERDFFMMSNTWGDRSRDGRVSEPFLLAELPAAAALGLTHYQIDDGWQRGATANSVQGKGRWEDYYRDGDGFWEVHPERFPNGLDPVVKRAKELGLQLGLWFSPDSSRDFRNWEKDAEVLLQLHRKYGIRYFKLDGINIASKRGETNLLNMMRKVMRETAGDVYFNLDTTAQVRLGYFGQTQYGCLFLENRYTDWRNYYPHWTLRNLWQLSRYVPAQKLQIEFLNVSRNTEKYEGDVLAPSSCGLVYAFAVTLFANPLAWMEVTGLDKAAAEALSRAIHAVKPLHKDILSGHILPIGEEPSGIGWTGMQSIRNEREGYVLIIREWNEASEAAFTLWDTDRCRLKLTCVMAMHERDAVVTKDALSPAELELEPNDRGEYRFTLPAPHTFALYRYVKM